MWSLTFYDSWTEVLVLSTACVTQKMKRKTFLLKQFDIMIQRTSKKNILVYVIDIDCHFIVSESVDSGNW